MFDATPMSVTGWFRWRDDIWVYIVGRHIIFASRGILNAYVNWRADADV